MQSMFMFMLSQHVHVVTAHSCCHSMTAILLGVCEPAGVCTPVARLIMQHAPTAGSLLRSVGSGLCSPPSTTSLKDLFPCAITVRVLLLNVV